MYETKQFGNTLLKSHAFICDNLIFGENFFLGSNLPRIENLKSPLYSYNQTSSG